MGKENVRFYRDRKIIPAAAMRLRLLRDGVSHAPLNIAHQKLAVASGHHEIQDGCNLGDHGGVQSAFRRDSVDNPRDGQFVIVGWSHGYVRTLAPLSLASSGTSRKIGPAEESFGRRAALSFG